MDFNATIELIIKDLNETSRIIDDFKSYAGVPELHVELAKAKCKNAAELISLLKKAEPKTAVVDKQVETILQQPLTKEKKASERDIFFIEEKPIIEESKALVNKIEIVSQPVIPEKTEIEIEKKPTKEKPVEAPKKASSIIADNFSGISSNINEQLGNKQNKEDVTSIIKSKHINSLRNEIGLNDKFLLIREIFNGDKETYEQTITKLEEVTTLIDAKTIISEYSAPESDSEAIELLTGLVKRKLHPDE